MLQQAEMLDPWKRVTIATHGHELQQSPTNALAQLVRRSQGQTVKGLRHKTEGPSGCSLIIAISFDHSKVRHEAGMKG